MLAVSRARGFAPRAARFAADGGHGEKKQRVLGMLGAFFERFFGLGAG